MQGISTFVLIGRARCRAVHIPSWRSHRAVRLDWQPCLQRAGPMRTRDHGHTFDAGPTQSQLENREKSCPWGEKAASPRVAHAAQAHDALTAVLPCAEIAQPRWNHMRRVDAMRGSAGSEAVPNRVDQGDWPHICRVARGCKCRRIESLNRV